MMWALKYKMEKDEDWKQSSFEFIEEKFGEWVGPLMWPSLETDPKKVLEEFYNSLQDRVVYGEIIGQYEKKGDKWQLIHYK